jgi:hypothetical protein
MKLSSAGLALLTAALVASQQATDKPAIEDRQGRFRLWGFVSTGIEFTDGGFTFGLSGNPVRGESQQQGLTFTCKSVEGRVRQMQGGRMRLETATMTGDVDMKMSREGGGAGLKAAKVVLIDDGQEATATVPSAFTFTDDLDGADGQRSVRISGPAGTFKFDPLEKPGERPLRAAEVKGRTTAVVKSTGKDGSASAFTVVGDSAVYSGVGRTLTLTGNVTFDGDQSPPDGPGFVGTIRGLGIVVVTFNEDGTLAKIDAKGSPGRAEMQEKKSGGG